MVKRKLGKSGLELAPLAFGGNVFGWTIDEPTSFEILDAFVAEGFGFIDTADVYSIWAPGNVGGESEVVLGNWMKRRGNRDKVQIATKAGNQMGPDKKGLSKAYILSAIEDSLVRLQTDYVDLYQSHVDDPTTPPEETLEAYAILIEQGKVRAIGASNFTAARLKESLSVAERPGYPRYESLQPRYNLYAREEFEAELAPLCLEKEIGVIGYSSLASGFLTGKYRTEEDAAKSPRGSGAIKYLDDRGLRILEALDRVSAELGTTPAAVALAWLIAQPSITAPIASATSIAQLNGLIEATRLRLDESAMRILNDASAWFPSVAALK